MKGKAIPAWTLFSALICLLLLFGGVKQAHADFGQNFMRNVDLFLEDFQLHGYLEQRLEVQGMDYHETDFDEAGEFRQIRTTVYGDISTIF